MDTWQTLFHRANDARYIILIVNLAFLVPLSICEIAFIQKFKVDKLFFFTCLLYTCCFSLRLTYYTCFEGKADLSAIE